MNCQSQGQNIIINELLKVYIYIYIYRSELKLATSFLRRSGDNKTNILVMHAACLCVEKIKVVVLMLCFCWVNDAKLQTFHMYEVKVDNLAEFTYSYLGHHFYRHKFINLPPFAAKMLV